MNDAVADNKGFDINRVNRNVEKMTKASARGGDGGDDIMNMMGTGGGIEQKIRMQFELREGTQSTAGMPKLSSRTAAGEEETKGSKGAKKPATAAKIDG